MHRAIVGFLVTSGYQVSAEVDSDGSQEGTLRKVFHPKQSVLRLSRWVWIHPSMQSNPPKTMSCDILQSPSIAQCFCLSAAKIREKTLMRQGFRWETEHGTYSEHIGQHLEPSGTMLQNATSPGFCLDGSWQHTDQTAIFVQFSMALSTWCYSTRSNWM